MTLDFSGGPIKGNPPASAGGAGSSPGTEDSTCYTATKTMCQNHWSLKALEPVLCDQRGQPIEKAACSKEDPVQSEVKEIHFLNE